jgi:CBS domain-containing protein
MEIANMIVSEVMSSSVYLADPDDSLQAAAQSMADLDTGVLPVGEGDRVIGILTDRDVVVRAVAKALDVENTPIREIMSGGVCYCFEDESVEDVAQQMAELQIRRLPVVNREKRLVGIVSLGDLSRSADVKVTGEALQGVAEKGLADSGASSDQKVT